ncbi:hypothetical protein LX36DRAFT_446801 [Colletotrichum falcatum]|nr:hypothetical protein LX36DRAFT_446801 [Colletotrichum falcatum]
MGANMIHMCNLENDRSKVLRGSDWRMRAPRTTPERDEVERRRGMALRGASVVVPRLISPPVRSTYLADRKRQPEGSMPGPGSEPILDNGPRMSVCLDSEASSLVMLDIRACLAPARSETIPSCFCRLGWHVGWSRAPQPAVGTLDNLQETSTTHHGNRHIAAYDQHHSFAGRSWRSSSSAPVSGLT